MAVAATLTVASVAQTQPAAKKAAAKKECCKKEGHSCCSPGSKAKVLTSPRPAAPSKKS